MRRFWGFSQKQTNFWGASENTEFWEIPKIKNFWEFPQKQEYFWEPQKQGRFWGIRVILGGSLHNFILRRQDNVQEELQREMCQKKTRKM